MSDVMGPQGKGTFEITPAHEAYVAIKKKFVDALFANAPVGLGFLDTHLRYVRINRKLAEINGRRVRIHPFLLR